MHADARVHCSCTGFDTEYLMHKLPSVCLTLSDFPQIIFMLISRDWSVFRLVAYPWCTAYPVLHFDVVEQRLMLRWAVFVWRHDETSTLSFGFDTGVCEARSQKSRFRPEGLLYRSPVLYFETLSARCGYVFETLQLDPW